MVFGLQFQSWRHFQKRCRVLVPQRDVFLFFLFLIFFIGRCQCSSYCHAGSGTSGNTSSMPVESRLHGKRAKTVSWPSFVRHCLFSPTRLEMTSTVGSNMVRRARKSSILTMERSSLAFV